MASWFERNIGRPLKNIIRGQKKTDEAKLESLTYGTFEGGTRVAFVDDQGREHIQRASDFKILDPLTGLWLPQEAFKYFAQPVIMAQENPQLFEEFMQSVAETNEVVLEREEALDDFLDYATDEEIRKLEEKKGKRLEELSTEEIKKEIKKTTEETKQNK